MATRTEIERLFCDNYSAMYALASRLLRDDDASRDVVHDVFAGLITADASNVTTAYLKKAVCNQCYDRLRRIPIEQRMRSLYPIELKLTDGDAWPDEDTFLTMRRVVDTLSAQCRRVVEMRFDEGLSYRQIAESLSISEVMVYKHLRHALHVLREKMKMYGQN